jgi:DNA-binding CsgD family transcriptional regulator
VLRLLVDGRSNQEIAAVLSISPNTVANHVANIMNKLGLDSRTAVVAWAVRHEIA